MGEHRLSARGEEFIAHFEGLRTRLYNDPAGHCSIGIGHLVHLGRCNGAASEAQFRNGISRNEAFELMRRDPRCASSRRSTASWAATSSSTSSTRS